MIKNSDKMIPLILRLKKSSHREIAKAQDLIVTTLYEVFNNAVLHGGTTIWRCYGGKRFSEDVDAYLPKDLARVEHFFKKLQQKGFVLEKKKIGENSIYSNLKLSQTKVRFEALFKKAEGHLQEYETAEGNIILVSALSPEELIEEKVNTYLKRRKIRDLYDLFILLRQVKDKTPLQKKLKELLDHFKEPEDEKDLQILILEGLVPSSQKMREYLRSWT